LVAETQRENPLAQTTADEGGLELLQFGQFSFVQVIDGDVMKSILLQGLVEPKAAFKQLRMADQQLPDIHLILVGAHPFKLVNGDQPGA
jgi:hypothetical protein